MSWVDRLRNRSGETHQSAANAAPAATTNAGQFSRLMRRFFGADEPALAPPAKARRDGPRTRFEGAREMAGTIAFTTLSAAQANELSAAGTSAPRDGAAAATAFALAPQLVTEPGVIPEVGEFAPGHLVADTYRIKRVLGGSKRFNVYLAEHLGWDIEVVIKTPRPEALQEPGALRNLAVDAAQWTALGLHPHIVYCHQVHMVQAVPFVILEYLNGSSLRPWISSGRTTNLRVGLSLGIQLCHALEHAHAQGTWHSALMPENLLLTADGVLRVGDFWTSSRPRVVTAPTAPAGARGGKRAERPSDSYVAPELWVDAAELDAQTDIFALGVCLYEIFCGARPYEIARGPRRTPPEPRAPGDRALPERLATLLKSCVDWDQERRPLTVADIRQELAELHREIFGRASAFAELPNQSWEADGWNNQALVALRQGRIADAAVAWEHALAAHAAHPETAYNYGVSRWRAGDATDEALLRHLEDVAAVPGQAWTARYLLALVHLERGDARTALTLLEAIAPEARGVAEVETALEQARTQSQSVPAKPRVFAVHRGFVSGVCLNGDGRWLLSSGDDNTLRLTDCASGRIVRTLEGHHRRVGAVRISADGLLALSGGDDLTLRLWEIKTGRVLHSVRTPGSVLSVALSADASRALAVSYSSDKVIDDTCLQAWDIVRERPVGRLVGHTNAVKVAALSADGRRAVSGGDDHTVRLWDVNNLSCRYVLQGHDHYVSAVAISADGARAVSGSWDRTVRLWDTTSGRCLGVLKGHEGIVTSVCLSSDGTHVVSGGWDQTVRLWDLASGRCLRTFTGHSSMITAVDMAADGRLAASASWDKSVRLWELPRVSAGSGALRLSVRLPSPPLPSADPEPEELLDQAEAAAKAQRWAEALGHAHALRDRHAEPDVRTARLWRALSQACARVGVRSMRPLANMKVPHEVSGLTLGRDARALVTAANEDRVRVWDVDLERTARTLSGHADRALDVCASADESLAISAGADRTLRLWNLQTGDLLRTLDGHQSIVTATAMGADQQRAVSGSFDHTVRVWNLATGDCLRTLRGHTRQVTAVALSADGQRALSSSLDGTLRLWAPDQEKPVRVLTGHTSGVLSARLSADGAWAVSGGKDHSVRLWDCTSGTCTRVLDGHESPVTGLALTRDGTWCVTAGHDRSVRLWNLRDGTCAHVIDIPEGATAVAFSDDACYLAIATKRPGIAVFEVDWELE